jgi:hypothetical protein
VSDRPRVYHSDPHRERLSLKSRIEAPDPACPWQMYAQASPAVVAAEPGPFPDPALACWSPAIPPILGGPAASAQEWAPLGGGAPGDPVVVAGSC